MATDQPDLDEEAIFNAAKQFADPCQSAAYLEVACKGKAGMRQRIERLLGASAEADHFFERKAGPSMGKTLPSDGSCTDVTPISETPGTLIGRYKLLQKIGEGGCGVVYMAEQAEPVRRRVALKVIKPGMDTRQVLARFEAERQALALMDHPNIARVLDAGATATGRPFFVMELVKGVRITEYCDQNHLSTVQRLELFVQICQAIQHAHQKGIIHRDIKPSNILVTLHDGVPVPKVIDFGIAKATTGQQLTDKTLFTAFEQFVGTPAYMSPEQVELSGLDVDTRSDIYSLGVLLYELLTGKTPFDAKELMAVGLEEMRRTIREKDPVRPSTRLSTMLEGELTTTAKQRQCEALRLIALLRGDLDWIVMKTLEKDRTRRYETANGLAMDVRRYLADEPVLARPPSRAYRLQKLIRRNKVVFGAAAAAMASLIIGLVVSGWFIVKEKKQRQIAEQQRNRAAQAQTTAETAQRLADKRARQLLSAVRYFRFGNTNLSEAESFFRETIALQQKSPAHDSAELAQTFQYLAMIQDFEHKEREAIASLREALALEKKVLGDADPEVATTSIQLGRLLQSQGKLQESELAFREALSQLRKQADAKPSQADHNFGIALHHLADVLRQEKNSTEAAALAREAIAQYNRHPEWPASENAHAQKVLSDILEEAAPAEGQLALNRLRQGRQLTLDGVSHARQGDWAQAAADFAHGTELEPSNHWNWFFLGPVLAAKGDLPAFQTECAQMLKLFGDFESPMIAERIAKVCLLLPSTLNPQELAQAGKLAERATEQGQDSQWFHWFSVTRGLAEYRLGHFTNAVDWVQQAQHRIPHSRDLERWVCELDSYLVLAMAQFRLNHPQEARTDLARAVELAQQHELPNLQSPDLGPFWHDVVIARLLLNEAQTMIETPIASKKE